MKQAKTICDTNKWSLCQYCCWLEVNVLTDTLKLPGLNPTVHNNPKIIMRSVNTITTNHMKMEVDTSAETTCMSCSRIEPYQKVNNIQLNVAI
jgi:hypothetical protein